MLMMSKALMLRKLTIVQSNKRRDPSKHGKRTRKRRTMQRQVELPLESTPKTMLWQTIRRTERIRDIKRNP
jgi:hypothetical protein